MGRIQSSVGLITGTNITGTVDQLIAISGQPRDRLVSRTNLLRQEQQALAELTASVIGVQLAGNQLANSSSFRSKSAESSNSEALSALAGTAATPASHTIRTLRTAGTHTVGSLQRFDASDEALGFTGTISVNPDGGSLDSSAELSKLNDGRGVEPGTIRITDRSGASTEIDFADARTIDDVLSAINDAEIDVTATTENGAIKLIDNTGQAVSNLRIEQLGSSETAADLGLWGIDEASDTATGIELELPAGVSALRGTALSELNGGAGIVPTTLDITLSDGSSASIDLSAATTTSEVIDAIEASGLSLIARYNDAKNGLQIRDVSGGTGNISISSADGTAAALGLEASTTDDIVVGSNLNRQSVTADTLLADLNQGDGVTTGSFTITDSDGGVGAINLSVDDLSTVGDLVDKINGLGIGVTASLNEAGDGIALVDTAGGSGTLTVADSGNGTAAADLGIAGTAADQTIGGSTVSALVGTQAGVINIEADDTLSSIAEKINEDGRYGEASVVANDDGTFSLRIRSDRGGEAGRFAINTSGFDLSLRTETRGQDALIAVSTDGGLEQFIQSTDGVFELDGPGTGAKQINSATALTDLAAGANAGSFTITDSDGVKSAINLTVENISTVGDLVDAVNNLGIGVSASINEAGTGIAIVDTADGSGELTIEDVGNGNAAASLGISGTGSDQKINGQTVSALVGTGDVKTDESSGLTLTLKQLSDSPITVTVGEDTKGVETAAKSFVDQYNKLADKLKSLTFFDSEANEVGLLFGSSEAQRIGNGYSRLLSGVVKGAGTIKSVAQVGIRFNDQGKLDLDTAKLRDAVESNLGDVEQFFTADETGLADRLSTLADRIAGADTGLLLSRSNSLSTQIERNNDRIDTLNSRLERERERLLARFYSTEEAIAKIQSNSSAVDQIQRITIPT